MSDLFTHTNEQLDDTFQLVKKSLYKTIEFQLLFKIFYVSIFLFLINAVASFFLSAIDVLITKIHLGEAIQNIPLLSLFDFKIAFVFLVSLFVIMYTYLIEKNGVIIITAAYYRNDFISFFRTLFISIQKTPIFIFRRFWEMRIAIFVFVTLYLIRKILPLFDVNEQIMTLTAIALIIYGAVIVLTILFHYTFTAYITCLEPKESFYAFNKNIRAKTSLKKIFTFLIFYMVFLTFILLWALLFYFVVHLLLALVALFPSFTSVMMAFFIAFTVVSIVIVLSILKTIKISLITVLYYKERRRQKRKIIIKSKEKQPHLSQNTPLTIVAIFFIAFIGSVLLTKSLKTQTDRVLENAESYTQYMKDDSLFEDLNINTLTPQLIIEKSHKKTGSTIDVIEDIVFTYLANISK